MTNKEKAKEIALESTFFSDFPHHAPSEEHGALRMAEWKDEQPISEQGGWHEEEPTVDGWYLVDTPDFPKNCYCVVAEWDNTAKHFYSEETDDPIDFCKWKLIEKRVIKWF